MAVIIDGTTGIATPGVTDTGDLSVSGTTALTVPLPVTSGGTGASSLSGITVGNLAGGSAGTIPYQSTVGTTAMLATGTAGQVLTSVGALAAPTWTTLAVNLVRSSRTSNTILGVADSTKLIAITSGTFSQTFTAAATLGSGWFVYIQNAGTGDITLDPNASETIDGLTSFIMYPGETRIVQCDGTAFNTILLTSFQRTFNATDTFYTPPGYNAFSGFLWAGGGSGGSHIAAGGNGGAGGGGGACVPFTLASSLFATSLTVTIGAGGVAVTNTTNGNVGGNSTIGSLLTSYGGNGGATNGNPGGTGGGILDLNGSPLSYQINNINSQNNTGYGGAWGGQGINPLGGGNSVYGGAGGGSQQSGSSSGPGGNSVYGGAGGGAADGSAPSTSAGGTSLFGGAGGAGKRDGTNGVSGTQPGGGGGGCYMSPTGSSGAGGAGRLIIRGVV